MRTTLNIEDDVLLAAQDIARRERRSLGAVASEVMRKGLAGPEFTPSVNDPSDDILREMGLFPLARRGAIVTNELVHRIRDDEGV